MTHETVPQVPIEDDLTEAAQWLAFFSDEWEEETPTQIHQRQFDDGGAPQWHPEFAAWLDGTKKRDERRLRTTRAFRKLRRKAPREFDVLYCICKHKMTTPSSIHYEDDENEWLNRRLDAVAKALTERAIKIGAPERYNRDGVTVLMLSGLDKVKGWW
jgi:hypothetical protein